MCGFGNGHRNIVSPLSEHQSFSFHNTGFFNFMFDFQNNES